ncbi:engulfment and cell motility protein 3 isoform X1 [Conger conger]|uniref:engulfment and cell motility protein 3 isoform X1 n=1 Tax=Conger conger TaxID=82655 RepID=UPI002A5ACA13|nr:engulfment and cell motility protein 3 isoform X1 [Conger conger]XP_061102348.1 engulfment and cell motility protein 3 isoform X1 [Conger conger]XP_061102349.1 engulfment and cell motility protein 3 isoform X1 [Conger conger]
MPPPKDIVKIAIQMPGAYPQLIDLDQKKPLSAVIKEVCDGWNLPGPDNYALQYTDGIQTYITESNRLDIKNGSILRLTQAPGRCAEDLYKGIQSSDGGVRCDSLKQLASVSTDVTFAQEFISRDGHTLLVHIVESANENALIMTHTLTAFMELMDHGIVSWENLSSVFIKKIASFVNAKSQDASIQQLSLAILGNMVLSSSSLFTLVKQEVTLERLILHMQVTNQQIQTKAMALLMALLLTAGETDRQELFAFLSKKDVRQYIYKNIIHSSGSVGDEMAHYLYVLQSVSLNHLEPRMRTPLDSYNQDQREVLHALRQAAFVSEADSGLSHERRRSLCAKEFKKLGFSNNSNPGQDLIRTPPGLLALDTMTYFASSYPGAYSRFVLENSSREDKHECPFARSSIQLTLILCEILRIGEPPSETGSDYHPVFFSQDCLLNELFCICIQLLNKTWKEMRATQEDFDKVMQVVREQITRTLSTKPTSLELFKNKVNALNYSEILKLRQTERLHQEETLAPPVLELKERLKPELLELIRQQRLNRLCHGTLFRKISSRRRQDKLWYCRLSPNHKVLHYGDVEEDSDTPPIEMLQEKIPVSDIKALLTGKDCPHMKEYKGKQNKEVLDLAFSITYDVEEDNLNFIASSRTDFCLWTDGLSVLLGRDMTSECMRSELEILLSMEIKLRLLDLENVPIPESAPPIPKPPSNFNFCYDYSQTEQ